MNEVVLVVDGVDDALAIIARLQAGEEMTFPDRIHFGGELSKVTIDVKGDNYHSSIPGNFARGIWEFQQEIYRAVAAATSGVTDLRKLSRDAYDQYNLVFEVSEGSTGLAAKVEKFLTALGKGLSDMDDNKKLIAILGIAITVTTGYAAMQLGGAYIRHESETNMAVEHAKVDAARIEADVKKEQERTKQIELLVRANPIVQTFSQAIENGIKSVIKSVPDAHEATVGDVKFDRQRILDMNSRAARESRDISILIQNFKIIGFKRPEGSDIGRYTLASKSGEISAILDMSEDGPFTKNQIAHFWNAGLNQNPIMLTVEVRLIGDTIKQALISDIHVPPPPLSVSAVQF